jgi:O-methyltransferase
VHNRVPNRSQSILGMLKRALKSAIQTGFRTVGLEIRRYRPASQVRPWPLDLTPEDREILQRVTPYTMTSAECQMALIQSVRHIVSNRVEGCLVECGVWRGGSSMVAALALTQMGDMQRDLYLFDTFEGMTAASEHDTDLQGHSATSRLERDPQRTSGVWAVAGIDEVRKNIASTSYPAERVHYIQGPVEVTIPANTPAQPIALLRLDTDWYQSTKHELLHLYSRMAPGGILIVDDYGHWQGARKAVDEFFASQPRPVFLHRIDYTARLVLKEW